ncbi:helix-turn-helix domain-containing protein [Brucella haematophila]|uniref:Helix-turn-helix transcriptional regulator n=1 Tax=Brucella haematophila TaxID=419474 RepID=A0ABX1DMC9_9HYPH|nr:helix-turn-helix transcriptional regulator [Brucella haematophila]NKC04089.1 helix-turn-helix transcriptional regulator [Brucella haematophila]TMV05871.1 helix-turn-helix transcriptional regulator [Brucella haematophila]
MTPMQLRLARTALKWGVRELAEASGITANTISRIENGNDAKQSTIQQLRRVLEEHGIEFIETKNSFGVLYDRSRDDGAGNNHATSLKIEVPKPGKMLR